ncbi:MAG: hypothetical protein JWO30_3451 [Fibrobacteres bacterium]|nr:hypothetical protein [Fibrobacterota bacterium]
MVIRIFKRRITNEVLWSGNKETLAKHFFTKDSMLLWVIKTFPKKKREYRSLFKDQRFNHLEKIELRSQSEVDSFLNK